MQTFLQDLRYAIRAMIAMRAVALAAVLTLALGIGATTTMFSVVYAALLRPLPFANPDRVAMVFTTQMTPRDGLVRLRWSWPRFLELQKSATSFETIAAHTAPLVAISGGQGEPEQIDGEVVSPEYFRVLRVTPLAGRPFGADESSATTARPVAMVGARLWRRRFAADPALIGRTVRVNDVPLTVVGILPDGFAGLSGKSELWIPPPMAARLSYADYLTTPQNFISAVARLKDGVSLVQANAELTAIGSRLALAPGVESPPGAVWSVVAVSLDDLRTDPLVRRSALLLLGAAACVLLVACVNVASLLLARARLRRREMAVRLAIGSSRRRLIQQLLTEGLLMAVLGGVAGTVLAAWGIAVLARTVPGVIPSGRTDYLTAATFGAPSLGGRVLLFTLAIALATTVAFALVPAIQASRAELATALKEHERGSARQGRTLSVLVVTEVALASLLLFGSGLLLEGFVRIQNRQTGYVSNRVLTFWVRPPTSHYAVTEGPAIVERLLMRVQAAPGVESAAVNRCTPFTGCSGGVLFLADRPRDRANSVSVGRHYVSADYFRTLGIPVLAGRALRATDRAGTPLVAVVNETGARRLWPGENPIGKHVWFDTTFAPFSDHTRDVEVVGVAGDVKYGGVDQPDNPNRADFYTSYLQFSFPDTMIIVKARAAVTPLVPALRQAVASVDAALPIYDVLTLDDRIGAAVARPRFNAALLSAFAGAALLLAAIGVYGVLSYSVSSQMRDMGVRIALGADARRVIARVLGQGLRLAAIGAAIGLLGALALSRAMQRLDVFGQGAPVSAARLFAAVVVVMMTVAGMAAFLPARRAARVDPMIVLRHE